MQNHLDAAVEAARRAGALLRGKRNTGLVIENKAEYDFVTNADRESEALIYSILHSAFPEARFYGEEDISGGSVSEDDYLNTLKDGDLTWIVDALDGTTNFIHGLPQSCISIGLAKGKELVQGVIYDPWRDDLFTGVAGQGAFLNGRRIWVSDTAAVSHLVFSTSFPAADLEARRYLTHKLDEIGPLFTSLRIFNCAALSLAYTACGYLDAHFELGLHLWDMAAGAVIIREAGGSVSNGYGEPFTVYDRDIFASNDKCHKELSGLLCRTRTAQETA